MKLKWYIGALIIILTFLGVGQHQISVPNQQIVLQFADDASSDETQNAVAIVKKQLQDVGADNIIVSDGKDGRLNISYYSNLKVARIKNILSEETQLDLGIVEEQYENDSKLPFDENQNTYNFDVYEIQKESNSDWDFNGTNILELKSEANGFSKPKVYTTINGIDFKETYSKVTYNTHYANANAIDNNLGKIPEVR
ncbi:MAG: hypothetical protein HKO81_02095, partial [Flavobacteriaceae bacterium]|nr:hypothetical protein [Flavobacteriaceae bacterium]